MKTITLRILATPLVLAACLVVLCMLAVMFALLAAMLPAVAIVMVVRGDATRLFKLSEMAEAKERDL